MPETDDTLDRPAILEPEIGMGVTMAARSDRLAGTIQEIFTVDGDIAITCTLDQCLPDGSYRTRPEAERYSFRRYRTDDPGLWRQIQINRLTRRWRKTSAGLRLTLGERSAHMDPHF